MGIDNRLLAEIYWYAWSALARYACTPHGWVLALRRSRSYRIVT